MINRIDVEDMEIRLLGHELMITDYPSSAGWTTIAFEDNWPLLGDYDTNDLVVYLRKTTYRRSQGFTQVSITGQVAAAGAEYHNGFGIRLPGVKASDVNPQATQFKINGQTVYERPLLEPNREEAAIIVSHDVFDYVGSANHCKYFRTEPGFGSPIQMSFEISIGLNEPLDVNLRGVFDPFLFASEGEWHGAHFVNPPGYNSTD